MMWETLMRHYKEIKNQVTRWQMEHDARVSYCSRCCDRTADRATERKVWFYLSFPEGLLSVVRNSWQQERKISYCFCGQKAEEDKMQCSICFLLFIQYRAVAAEMVPPKLGVDHPFSTDRLGTCPHRYTQRCLFSDPQVQESDNELF